jgi:DNA-binding response OmpR family regulator
MFDAGADSYLTKPFQLPELVDKLKERAKSGL